MQALVLVDLRTILGLVSRLIGSRTRALIGLALTAPLHLVAAGESPARGPHGSARA
jgi:hypothetical protein